MEALSPSGNNIEECPLQTLLTSEAIPEPLVPGTYTKPVKKLPENEGLNVVSTIIKEDLAQKDKVKLETAERLENTIVTKMANKTIVNHKDIEETPPLENDEASKLAKDSTLKSSDGKDRKTALNKTNDNIKPSIIDTTQGTIQNNKTEAANATTQTYPDTAANKANKPIEPINTSKELTDRAEPDKQKNSNNGLSPRSTGKYPNNYKVTNVEELQCANLGFQPLTMDNINVTGTNNQQNVKLEPRKPRKPDAVKPVPKKTPKEVPYYEKVRKMLDSHQSILKTITAREFDVYMANLVCNMKPNSKVSSKETTRKYISDFERAKKHETVPHQIYLESLWRKEQLKVKEPELRVQSRKVPVQCVRKKKVGLCLEAIRTFGYIAKTSIEMLGLTNIIPKPEGIVF